MCDFHAWWIFKIICIYHSRWKFWFPCTFLKNNPSILPKNSIICYRIQLAHFEGSFSSQRKVCRSYFQCDNQSNPMEMDIGTWESRYLTSCVCHLTWRINGVIWRRVITKACTYMDELIMSILFPIFLFGGKLLGISCVISTYPSRILLNYTNTSFLVSHFSTLMHFMPSKTLICTIS